jgi:hypothetical protein
MRGVRRHAKAQVDDAIAIGGIVLAVVVLALIGIVINQRDRLKRFEAKFGVGGIGLTVELSDLVKREVARISLASVARMAHMDQRLIEFWERERFLTPEEGAARISLLEDEIMRLERDLANAASEDKFQLAMQLREFYSRLLTHAREHWASSANFVQIRERVVAGLKGIERLASQRDA